MSGDLFGFKARDPPAKGEVALALIHHDDTAKAWLLSESGKAVDAQWVPKSQAKRGEGRDENVWTMPTWLAHDRGWT